MKKARILLLGGNYCPEPTGIGKYNGEMMDWLSNQGYSCAVVTTYPYYPFWKIQSPYKKNSYWYKKEVTGENKTCAIKVYRCPHYVPRIPCGKRRILSDVSFFLSALFQVILIFFRKKYDYVIAVAPPFQLGLLGILYKKVTGAKFIYHVQDLQIDAAFELGMIRSALLAKLMFKLERLILRKADYVSSISEGMIKRIRSKVDRNILLFPNWADTKIFHPMAEQKSFRKEYNILPEDKIVLYSGAIGEKQGLQNVLDSALTLQSRKDIKFIICGSGPYKEKLVDLAKEMKLDNVIFLPLQPKEKFNQFLNMADIHLVLQKANANDLVMPSKLTTILSVGGLVLVTASDGTSLHNMISKHKIGVVVEPENQAALTQGILDTIGQSHDQIRSNARAFAEEFLTINKIISPFFEIIMNGKEVQKPVRKEKERMTAEPKPIATRM